MKHHLKALKLPTMSQEYDKVASRAAVENLDRLTHRCHILEAKGDDPLPVSAPVLMRELGNIPRGVSEGGA